MEHKLIDIHMHLIPGVDDGAEDMDHALTMYLQAREQGVTAVFATPHSSAFDMFPGQTAQGFQHLRRWIPEVYPGCEVYCTAAAMDAVIAALRKGTYPAMNGTNCVLTEFPMGICPDEAVTCAKALLQAGFTPIIAHVERYRKLRGNMEQAVALCRLGCLLQVNVYSLFDETDEDIKAWARQLVLEKRIHFLGTDAHRTTHRPPSVTWGMKWLYAHCDTAYADRIAWANAQTILLRK